MQNVTDGEASPGAISDTSALEARVRNSVVHGNNVREEVRDFTVKALSKPNQDQKSLRKVVTAVMKGVSEGAQQKLQQTPVQTQTILEPVRDAVAGLDVALAQLAEASKLALEEAAGRAQKFSNEELAHARAELESVESLFLDIVQASASAAQELVKETLADLISHAKRNGTAVGSQVKDTLVVFNQQMTSVGQSQLEAGKELTHAITDLMREATAGVLAEIAERVKPDDISKRYRS
jgi:hypothetical protein